MPIRQAIITYDSEAVSQWNFQAEGASVGWIFKQSMSGEPYPAERGIISIRHVPEDSEVIVAPRLE